MTTYSMTAEENFDAERVETIAGLTTYLSTVYATDQNYQGIQWDAVRRNLMYMYVENTPDTPTTNTTGFTLWDGETAIAPDGAIDPSTMFNSSVGVKNIDTGTVTFYRNYNSANLVPAGINSSDGTWRRYTRDFQAVSPQSGNNGPGMTDPYTGNFWVNGQSCILYCFRRSDNYSQVISPLRPVIDPENIVQVVGFTDDWTHAREIDETVAADDPSTAYLYLTPREFTAAETSADELLVYATFTYPTTAPARYYHSYNREIFDHAGNMYLASCSPTGGKDFKLHRFEPPTSAPYGGPTVGGGFTDITPWGSSTGPNGDGADYTLIRTGVSTLNLPQTPSIVPLYLPDTDELVLIEKFFPAEKTAASLDPALMFWSCTYVGDPSGTPTFDHHSAFVTGYMTAEWAPTDLSGADYAVIDAFEVNNYLGQSDYSYVIDYTKRWFFFLCTKMTAGVSDGKARIVLVEYQFVNGAAPSVVQVIDEQGWDDTYPDYEADYDSDAYALHTGATSTAAVATAMQTIFNTDALNPLWDCGIHDPTTNTFWWSGGASDSTGYTPFFSLFDSSFTDRTADFSFNAGGLEQIGATPPFMKLSFDAGGEDQGTSGDPVISAWGYNLDGHRFYLLRLGTQSTMVYDRTTRQWAHWASPSKDYLIAHIGGNWLGIGATTLNNYAWNVIGGDDTTGNLWVLDPNVAVDDNRDGSQSAFTRKCIGAIPMRLRQTTQCAAVYLLGSLGEPALTGQGVMLETSDDNGHSWTDEGTVTITADDYSQELNWMGLGLIKAPGRLFRFTDTGALTRVSSADIRP